MRIVPMPARWRALTVALAIAAVVRPDAVRGAPGEGNATDKIASELKRQAAGSGAGAARDSSVRIDGEGRIQVRVQLERLDTAVLERLESTGMAVEIRNPVLGAARGWIERGRLAELAALEEVVRITVPDYRRTNAGSVEGEHDAMLRCNETREGVGVDGSGIRVGVISDGIDHVDTAQATGDAPAVAVPDDPRCHRGEGDEGSAMIEIVHDCAPGAEIAFCGPLDDLEMVDCLACLADVFGADVIVDDLGFVRQPYFEDGPVALAVEELTSRIAYFSSAGNQARTHYQATYVHCPDSSTRHDFGDGDCALDVTFSGAVAAVLQWDEPFGGASSDYDLCVSGDCSSDPQNGDDDPIESLVFTCGQAGACTRHLEINRFSGADRAVEIYFFPLGSSPVRIEHVVADDSIFGHPCAEGAVAVAAISASDPGTDTVELFSSRGPCTLGQAGAVVRPKPDVAGLDGISNTGAGGFPSPFFGTSASAPGVAAVAALLLDRDPSLKPSEVAGALRASAVDLGDQGSDSVFGAGRVDALAVVSVVTPRATATRTRTPTQTGTPTSTPTPGPCFGDCDADGDIAVDELVTAVRIALGMTADTCLALDSNADGIVAIDDVVRAINASLFRCATTEDSRRARP